MKILVTGGAGFIGSKLVKRLFDLGHEVHVWDNLSSGKASNIGFLDPNNFHILDIDNPSLFPEDNFDYIFHLAAKARVIPSFQDPELYHKVNVDGTFNVLKYAKEIGAKKVIFASSSSIYGDSKYALLSEDLEPHPQSPYASTKLIGEMLCNEFALSLGLPTVAMRFFNVYGEGMSDSQYKPLVQAFLEAHNEGRPLPVNGSGKQSRDFTHVDDVVEALISAMITETGEFNIFNVGACNDWTVLHVAQLFGDEIQYQPEVPNEPFMTRADIQKIFKWTGWKPQRDFEQSIKELIETYGK